jgi:hypothetical protein
MAAGFLHSPAHPEQIYSAAAALLGAFGVLVAASELLVSELFAVSELVELVEPVEVLLLELDELELELLFALPYPSEYQPPPFKMKLPLTICRRAFGLPQSSQTLIGSSMMRCSFSKDFPHASQT